MKNLTNTETIANKVYQFISDRKNATGGNCFPLRVTRLVATANVGMDSYIGETFSKCIDEEIGKDYDIILMWDGIYSEVFNIQPSKLHFEDGKGFTTYEFTPNRPLIINSAWELINLYRSFGDYLETVPNVGEDGDEAYDMYKDAEFKILFYPLYESITEIDLIEDEDLAYEDCDKQFEDYFANTSDYTLTVQTPNLLLEPTYQNQFLYDEDEDEELEIQFDDDDDSEDEEAWIEEEYQTRIYEEDLLLDNDNNFSL